MTQQRPNDGSINAYLTIPGRPGPYSPPSRASRTPAPVDTKDAPTTTRSDVMPRTGSAHPQQSGDRPLHVVPLPALADNYIWLLHDDSGHAIVVDPGEAAPVEAALQARKLKLCAILLTHHHNDHIGGADALRKAHGVPVYAPNDERITVATHRVNDGDTLSLQQPSARFSVIAVPGHTLSHIVFAGEGVLLCGDTLFSLGCGRLFEGTPEQMLSSLQRLASLPGDLLVCCGHEYTAANGRFALTVEPDNAALKHRLDEVARLRAEHQPSVPATLSSELACNPFMRVNSEGVMHWCHEHGAANDPVARFAALRSAKDIFRA